MRYDSYSSSRNQTHERANFLTNERWLETEIAPITDQLLTALFKSGTPLHLHIFYNQLPGPLIVPRLYHNRLLLVHTPVDLSRLAPSTRSATAERRYFVGYQRTAMLWSFTQRLSRKEITSTSVIKRAKGMIARVLYSDLHPRILRDSLWSWAMRRKRGGWTNSLYARAYIRVRLPSVIHLSASIIWESRILSSTCRPIQFDTCLHIPCLLLLHLFSNNRPFFSQRWRTELTIWILTVFTVSTAWDIYSRGLLGTLTPSQFFFILQFLIYTRGPCSFPQFSIPEFGESHSPTSYCSYPAHSEHCCV